MDYRSLITIEPGKRGGKPCIRGLRITVHDVPENLASGMSEDEVLSDFPDLAREDIHACLAFAALRSSARSRKLIAVTLSALVAPSCALATTITRYAVPTASSTPRGITRADGNVWFTELDRNEVRRPTADGRMAESAVPTADRQPYGVAGDRDGNTWFTETHRRGSPYGPFLGASGSMSGSAKSSHREMRINVAVNATPDLAVSPAVSGEPAAWHASLASILSLPVDNGDGTITDLYTGLMWEKLSYDRSIHDHRNVYRWRDAFAVKVASLNAQAFAGYTDWRVPNRGELESIVSLETSLPAVNPAFNRACANGCTVTTCSCTASDFYWSSTIYMSDHNFAWFVDFTGGFVGTLTRRFQFSVRAVRGGTHTDDLQYGKSGWDGGRRYPWYGSHSAGVRVPSRSDAGQASSRGPAIGFASQLRAASSSRTIFRSRFGVRAFPVVPR